MTATLVETHSKTREDSCSSTPQQNMASALRANLVRRKSAKVKRQDSASRSPSGEKTPDTDHHLLKASATYVD